MFFYLLLLFTLIPFVELVLLLWLAQEFGWLHTLLLIIFTGVLGASLARWQGLRTLGRIQQEMSAGKVPGDALVDGLLILMAGAVLLTPGILTDACGFALLVPPIRSVVKKTLRHWFENRVHVQTTQFRNWSPGGPGGTTNGEHVVDAEATGTRVVDDDRQA